MPKRARSPSPALVKQLKSSQSPQPIPLLLNAESLESLPKLKRSKPTSDRSSSKRLDASQLPESVLAIAVAASPESPQKSKKLKLLATYASSSPFPTYAHPTSSECKAVHDLLASHHNAHPAYSAAKKGGKNSAETCGHTPDVLDALVGTILSQNTSNANSSAAKRTLDATFGLNPSPSAVGGGEEELEKAREKGWASLANAPRADVVEAIKHGGLANKKAKVIQDVLASVHAKHGVYSLQHLATPSTSSDGTVEPLSDAQIMEELVSYSGVGPKTASCVLLFCLGRDSFAVDTHVFRLTKMLGWVPAKADRVTTQAHLEVMVPRELKYALHVLFIMHGRACAGCKSNGKGKCVLRVYMRDGGLKMEEEETSDMKLKEEADNEDIKEEAEAVPHYDLDNLMYLSRPLRDIIKEATNLPRDGSVEHWIDEASKCVEKGKARKSEWKLGKNGDNKDSKDLRPKDKIVEDAFMNFAKAAVILRVKLPSLPEYDKLSEEKRQTVAFKLYEAFSYLKQLEFILDRTTYYPYARRPVFIPAEVGSEPLRTPKSRKRTDGEMRASKHHQKELKKDSDAWEKWKTLVRYEESSGAEELEGFKPITGHSDSMESMPGGSRSPSKALFVSSEATGVAPGTPTRTPISPTSPKALGEESDDDSIPESPPSPHNFGLDLHPIDPKSIPEVAPEPISIFLDLFPLDDSVIPDFSPNKLEFNLNAQKDTSSQ
ncbi:hypothetical protein HWV62_1196 [Athelia sp. TMB]|nr:hypothetical protein HWV62_1196 [Athelia sp. TMB]